eukprot:CAMPEP_0195288322 /NCGR_PEP_ID=MMETSP0707-20130614/5027_1 /TAXON_ID=33640 /ORGANISM="Asterionellopsis glacialis, Strain CCMP134" /LENGTH=665 /DNA_ID=CAMNT_0040348185 /DNA_START=71 /DNA_END=2068 /DNA_ORIENTATION=-
MRLTSAISLLLLISPLCSNVVVAERSYDELEWSSAKCKELGYEGVFDSCAIIEFCEGLEHGGWANRRTSSLRPQTRKTRLRGGNAHMRNLEGLFHGKDTEEEPTTPGKVEEVESSSATGISAEDTSTTTSYSPPPEDMSYEDASEEDMYANEEFSSPTSATNPNDVWKEDIKSAEHEEGYEYAIADYGWRIPGKECLTPGPIIRLDRGKRHGLFVKGSGTEEKTNFHAHGLHIAGSGNGDDVLREVSHDDILIYNLTIPDYHMGGSFWYHSHHHGSVNTQVSGGAYGMLIINDGNDVGTDDEDVLSFLQNERQLIIHGTAKSDYSANGVTTGVEIYAFNKDEWYRLRTLMVTIDDHRVGGDIEFPKTCIVHSVAHDGIFRFQVPNAEPKLHYYMTTSSRLDVAIKCHGDGDIVAGDDVVAKIKTTSSSSSKHKAATPFENGQDSWSSTRPGYLQDLREKNVDNDWMIKLDSTAINGQQLSDDQPLCNMDEMDFAYGSVQEWVLRGIAAHPFHLHTYPMQIIGTGCSSDHHDEGEYYDTVMGATYLQEKKHGKNQRCKIRSIFRDVAGKAVLHCHITKHEDMGAMGWINIVGKDAPVQPSEPRVHTCNGSTKDTSSCDPVHTVEVCGMEGVSVSDEEYSFDEPEPYYSFDEPEPYSVDEKPEYSDD